MSDAADGPGMRRTFIVPTITSFDHYDFTRAKIKCSLTWLVAKAFGSDAVPEELAEPFYLDQYAQEHLKPPVACLLQSAELYCRAGSLILRSDAVKPLLGHNAVIQALAQKCLYVTDQDRLVTERDLTGSPIHMSSHLALIDALMMAYTVEMVSVERVMSCIHRCSSAEPSYADGHAQELPYDTEDAIVTWINKVNQHLRDIVVEEQTLREAFCQESQVTRKARYRREQAQQRSAPPLPLVENLLKDNADGCSLAALLHFYCPRAVPMDDICLKETMSLADSLYNLQLVHDFCRDNLNHCCHFSLEDMLYTHASIKSNYLVFMAELFWWFEVVKPSFVQPRVFDPQACDPVPATRSMAPVSSPVKESYADRPASQEPTPTEGDHRDIIHSNRLPIHSLTHRRRSQPRTATVSSSGTLLKDTSTLRGAGDQTSSLRVSSRPALPPELLRPSPIMNCHLSSYFRSRGISFEIPYSNGGIPDGPHHGNHGNHGGRISPTTPPSIEEALKIIHDNERPHASLGLGAPDNGFFLHGGEAPDRQGPPGLGQDPGSPAKAEREPSSLSTDEVDTGIHVRTEDIQSLDEDSSSLRDYSDIDPDYEGAERSSPLRPRAGSTLPRSHTVSPVSSSTGGSGLVRMTSFAEQKFRKLEGRSSGGTTPESSELNLSYPRPSAGPPLPISSPNTPSPRDPTHLLASEMVHLKMKLEEKRRAIEAQKKKVEAAFTRHRQRMGRTAFLNVVRRKGITSPVSSHTAPKSPCEDGVGSGEIDITEYTRSIERLNTSLGFLQTEMQRLAQQQETIMSMREQQAWVIPPPAPSPHSSVVGRGSGRGSVGSLSPILSSSGSPRAPHRSPAGLKRRPASFHARTPRTPRPNDLKVTPFSRMLNTPTSVDSLPRLRRFSPSQTQTSSFAYLGHDEGPLALDSLDPQDPLDPQQRDRHPEEGPRQSAGALRPPAKGADAEPDPGERREVAAAGKATEGVISSEVRSQPGADHQGHGRRQGTAEQSDPGRRDLREVPLFQKDDTEEEAALDGGAGRDAYGDDQKMCCGFFFKDDAKGQEDMAAKREALLEKRLRREKEAQEKKVQQEQEQEEKKEAARLRAEEELQKKDDEKARRDYIKNEYLRRKQLKLMDDMNDVIKPRSGSLKKKPRPKSIHRDVVESPKPPVRAAGEQPHARLLHNTSNSTNTLSHPDPWCPTPRGAFLPVRQLEAATERKDWEIESTTSSTPSNTEYTGPKLYKEPSAKSNKHIIQNALAHCCLAGKVNEGQKNKILDEMEKSEANNFLVLFRDAGCQFRSVYTYCPESEEMTKLAGIGPKSITTKMVEGLYKYNSDRKQFSHIPAKTMSASVDAVTIASHLWQTKKQSTPKKLQPK
uniref:Calmodulin regulated spectrin-associated protein family, member 2b n=1 Tax=Gadus morhua TaxID=8049 RepID=A0A8C5CEB5_GADMO